MASRRPPSPAEGRHSSSLASFTFSGPTAATAAVVSSSQPPPTSSSAAAASSKVTLLIFPYFMCIVHCHFVTIHSFAYALPMPKQGLADPTLPIDGRCKDSAGTRQRGDDQQLTEE